MLEVLNRSEQPDTEPMHFSRPRIMGILNVTPDSFYSSSRAGTPAAALEKALSMYADGADIIDIGGESTRPGSEEVSPKEEAKRVLPVIKIICDNCAIPVSIDTRKASVAAAALDAGANMVNDVSALRYDAEMVQLVAERKVPVILMHMRGIPRNMQDNPVYEDTVGEVVAELSECVSIAREGGIEAGHIILDPGIGFGKRCRDNLALLRNIDKLRALGYPVLVGLSRKRFVSDVLSREKLYDPEDRLAGSLAGYMFCSMKKVEYLRVHDVRETVDMFRMLNAIEGSI